MSSFKTSQSAPRTVDDYLRQLRSALGGAPPGLVQDALADAEDYMREEVALDAYKPESEIVARITRSFGTPDEVAAEYTAVETRYQRRRGYDKRPRHLGFFSVALDPKAYGGMVYGLLALPLGIFYFTWVVAGLSMSLGFAILIIGVPFTLLFIASVRVIALLEGRIVESLLGQRMPRRLPTEDVARGLWPKIWAMLGDRRTWSTMFYMILQLPLGIAYFTVTIAGMSLSLSLMAIPLLRHVVGYNHVVIINGSFQTFFDSGIGTALLIAVGFVLFFAVLHLIRALTVVHGRYAEAALVRG